MTIKDNRKCEDPQMKHRHANFLDEVDLHYKQQIYGPQNSAASSNITEDQIFEKAAYSNIKEDQNNYHIDHNSKSF